MAPVQQRRFPPGPKLLARLRARQPQKGVPAAPGRNAGREAAPAEDTGHIRAADPDDPRPKTGKTAATGAPEGATPAEFQPVKSPPDKSPPNKSPTVRRPRRRQPPPTVVADPSLPALTACGIRLHAEIMGPSDAPLIVVLHGGPGGDYRSLLPLAALSDSFRLLFYDQRGAGLSERVEAARLTLGGHIDELHSLVAAHGNERPVILIGHSWGATLAAAYLGQAPERCARAVLIEPGYLDHRQKREWQLRARRYLQGRRVMVRAVSAALAALTLRPVDADARADHLWGRLAQGFLGHPDNPYHCPGQPWRAPYWRFGARSARVVEGSASRAEIDAIARRLDLFRGPVLLMAGACDEWLGAPLQKSNLGLFHDARLRVIGAAGHDVICDNPDAAVAAIRAFLKT